MASDDDALRNWFEANYPEPKVRPEDYVNLDFTDPDDSEPDYTDDEPFPSDPDPFSELQAENERLKEQLAGAAELLAHATSILQHYHDATPILYKLMSDLDLDEYRAADYELMLCGGVQTERSEYSMEWVLKRVPPEPPIM